MVITSVKLLVYSVYSHCESVLPSLDWELFSLCLRTTLVAEGILVELLFSRYMHFLWMYILRNLLESRNKIKIPVKLYLIRRPLFCKAVA